MTAAGASWLERFAGLPAGGDKVRPLAEAVRSAVRPGMTLHLAFAHNRPTAAIADTQRTDAATTLGALVGGPQARCLGSLGAAQVDAAGRFNSTRLADGTLLVGSGGANDVASAADEVVLTLPADRHRLVDEVPYVTGPGERVTAVVTDLGVLERERGAARWRLSRLVGPLLGGSPASHVRELQARCGFGFEVAADPIVEPPVQAEEVERLRLHDPERAFLGPLEGDA